MTINSGRKALLKLYPSLNSAIQQVRQDVFGHVPQLGVRTARKFNKKQLTGVYLNQYYQEPIAKFARKNIKGFMTEQEERRKQKLTQLRRRGKGPPKKGSGRK